MQEKHQKWKCWAYTVGNFE